MSEVIELFAQATYTIPEQLKRLNDEEEVSESQGLFRILSPKDGDVRVVWNKLAMSEINEAKNTFDEMLAKGMLAYRVGEDGKKSNQQMKHFDPLAQEIVFSPLPAMAGG